MAGQSINQQTMLLMQLSRDLVELLKQAEQLSENQTTAIKTHLSGLQRALGLERHEFNKMSYEERIDTVLERLKRARKSVEALRPLAQQAESRAR
jgi:hypothetical protein